jgi:hypothetical protein
VMMKTNESELDTEDHTAIPVSRSESSDRALRLPLHS